MPNKCVVQGCSNTAADAIIHKFPKDASLRRQWVRFVQVKRANFTDAQAQSTHGGVCSDHFPHDMETYQHYVRFQLGCTKWKNLHLQPGVVPTIQPKLTGHKRAADNTTESADVGSETKQRCSSAARKLAVARVS